MNSSNEVQCTKCGRPVENPHKRQNRNQCLACSIAKFTATVIEHAAQSGPAWDRFNANPRSRRGRPGARLKW